MTECEIMARAQCLCFNGHFSRWTCVSQYQNDSIPDYTGAVDDGDGGDNWSCKICKSSPSTNQPSAFTGQMPFLSPNQQWHSTEGKGVCIITVTKVIHTYYHGHLLVDAVVSRDLRSFEIRFESDVPIWIRFESDVPIRKFRISRTCHVPSYHKLRSLTVQQKHQPLRRL